MNTNNMNRTLSVFCGTMLIPENKLFGHLMTNQTRVGSRKTCFLKTFLYLNVVRTVPRHVLAVRVQTPTCVRLVCGSRVFVRSVSKYCVLICSSFLKMRRCLLVTQILKVFLRNGNVLKNTCTFKQE